MPVTTCVQQTPKRRHLPYTKPFQLPRQTEGTPPHRANFKLTFSTRGGGCKPRATRPVSFLCALPPLLGCWRGKSVRHFYPMRCVILRAIRQHSHSTKCKIKTQQQQQSTLRPATQQLQHVLTSTSAVVAIHTAINRAIPWYVYKQLLCCAPDALICCASVTLLLYTLTNWSRNSSRDISAGSGICPLHTTRVDPSSAGLGFEQTLTPK